MDGRDLSALLAGETDETPAFDSAVSLNAEVPLRRWFEQDREWEPLFTQEEYLNAFFYQGAQGALAAVRSGKWKLSLHPNLTLYNLEEDPGERSPVNDWKVKTKLRGMVIQYLREMKK